MDRVFCEILASRARRAKMSRSRPVALLVTVGKCFVSKRRPKYCTSEAQGTRCHEFEQSLEGGGGGDGAGEIELFVF
jgi:hypothetical protein